ncbi:MAG: MASE1 domain-containing protein [Candidatus Eremiobacteraeota bacterium]|nr:MASE1 domain-containing protein [Candidatus Eremiobacteraeota bacterium]
MAATSVAVTPDSPKSKENSGAHVVRASQVRSNGAVGAVIAVLLVAVAYVAAARFGFTFAFATKQVTAVWPPTGIALAALLLWGYRVWPGIWLGAFVSNATSSEPIWTAALIAIGNTLAPLFGAYLLRHLGFDTALNRVRDVILLVFLGSALAMTVSATNGVTALAIAQIVPWSAFLSVWWIWWVGDAMGVLLVAPLLLTWLANIGRDERPEGGGPELALLGVTLVAASWTSFLSSYPVRFSVYPVILWSAVRFRQRETTAAIAVVGAAAIWATTHGLGPWASGSLDLRLVQLDSWMAAFAITGLVLGAVSAEKRAARHALQTVLEQKQRSVDTLQRALLPARLPNRAGLQCDALYIPAEREALIGGDWYDAFELPDGRIVFSIGDVTGHGLDAAVTAERLRRGIFTAAFQAEDVAEILFRAEIALQSELDAPATAMVAVISGDLSTLSYANAGHPPAILGGPTAPVRLLHLGGVPMGVRTPIRAKTHTVALERGAVMLFYTDGLTEFARNIQRSESAAMQAVSMLIDDPSIKHPAVFVQRSVMGSHRPTDDTVLLVARLT